MNLELTDEQTEALIRGLRKLIDDDRFPLSPRIVKLPRFRRVMLDLGDYGSVVTASIAAS